MKAAIEPSALRGRLPCTSLGSVLEQPVDIVEKFVGALGNAIQRRDAAALARCFTDESLWRDSLAFTGTFRTFHSAATIAATWIHLCQATKPSNFAVSKNPHLKPKVVNISESLQWVEGSFTFDIASPAPATATGGCRLYLGTDGVWQAWTIFTLLEQFQGHAEVDPTTNRPPEMIVSPAESAASKVTPGLARGVPFADLRIDSAEDRDKDSAGENPDQVEVLIIGCGQSGLSLAGRCEGYGLTYLAIDKNLSIGDNWMNRYESVKLHTPRLWSAPPYMATSDADPEFLTRTHLAEMLKRYTKLLSLKTSLSTTVDTATYDETEQSWLVILRKQDKQIRIKARHIVFATGSSSQVPNIPDISDRRAYKGKVLHSVDFWNGEEFKGKRMAVIGTANTAHDVAQDLYDAGAASVTMVQRSPTYVLPAEYLCAYYASYYNESIPIEVADRMTNPGPMAAGRHLANMLFNGLSRKELPRFESLAAAGFKVIREGDLFVNIYGRGGGHYIDIGTSKFISEGKIKVKSGAAITSFSEEGLRFADGSSLDVDGVVFCTGFKDVDMVPTAKSVVGAEVLKQVHETNGIDEEGEHRGQWKPTGHESIWFMPGNVGTARYFSRLLALQLLADVRGHRLIPYYSHETM